jgi:acetoin utilization deacetylase AcuC-like enzyme
MRTGWVWDERYAWHDTGTAAGWIPAGGAVEPDEHCESPSTKRRFRNILEVSGLLGQLVDIAPRMATEDEILRLHTREYVDQIKRESAGRGGDAGFGSPFGPGSFEIALLAAGGCTNAIDAVIDGDVDNAYALVRPPGHHAKADVGGGFCIFGNTALSVMHARQARGLERVAIVDWDVHHGNGTEAAFYDDPSVLTISLHQDAGWPVDSGLLEHVGEGEGRGFNMNVPLPPGSGVGAYESAFDRVVVPALRAFDPDLIVVASGLDSSAMDPLGRMMITSAGYRSLTRKLMDAADELCGGKLLVIHEGGYSAAYVPFCGLAIVEELSGITTGVEDPFLEELSGGQALQPHQADAIAAAEANLGLLSRS